MTDSARDPGRPDVDRPPATEGQVAVAVWGPTDPPAGDLLAVLGWGNRLDHANVRWLVDRLVGAGYRVHAVELPTNVADVDRAYCRPIDRYLDDEPVDRVVGHSLGGLVAARLATDARRLYLSPWWGTPLPTRLLDLVARLPTTRPVFPVSVDRDRLGDLATDRQVRETPDGIAPAFLRAVRRAQSSLPPFRSDATVFCTLSDEVVSVRAIGRRAPADRTRLYDGGHELFSSSGRSAIVDRVVDALD